MEFILSQGNISNFVVEYISPSSTFLLYWKQWLYTCLKSNIIDQLMGDLPLPNGNPKGLAWNPNNPNLNLSKIYCGIIRCQP